METSAVPIAAVKAGLEMHPAKAPLSFGGLTMDTESGVAIAGDKAVKLTLSEAKLLGALLLTKGRILSQEAAYDALYWNRADADGPSEKVINVWLTFLRKHLRRLGYGVQNVKGFGWRLRELP